MPCNIIKLVDVQEMNYLAAKGEGEVSKKGNMSLLGNFGFFFFVPEITDFSKRAKHGLLHKI